MDMAPNKNNKSKRKSNKISVLCNRDNRYHPHRCRGIHRVRAIWSTRKSIAFIYASAYNFHGYNNTCANSSVTSPPTSETDPLYVGGTKVLLQTSVGNITLEMRNDKPITTTNFVNLVNKGIYDGTIFHRVIAGFMIQGGQNSSANVATIPDEIGNNNHNLPYTIAMAKTSDPNSATSQFFINVANNGVNSGPTFDSTYAVFGKVIAGQSVVDAIANAPVTSNAYEANSTPINPVTVLKATIIP